MKVRPDLVPETERDNLEVIQLTDESIPSSHIYMEAQIFTSDSQRLILHRSAHPHGSDPQDPEHQFLVCNLEDNCSLTPITTERGTTGPSISPDGAHLYYFVNETEPGGGGRLTLKRVGLDGSEREIVYVLDHAIPETDFRLSRPYPLSTISSDGGRIAISGFLGDGQSAGAPWGLLVFELEEPSVRLVFHGPTWCNMHPQYTRQTDPVASHDIMIQENHGNTVAADGKLEKLVSGLGADIHLIRDDGTNLRDFPWGRDGNEFCQGHQCWQGRRDMAITSTSTRQPDERQLISGRAVAHVGDEGINALGGWRNDLSRSFAGPDFWHFRNGPRRDPFDLGCGPERRGRRGLAIRPSRGRARRARECAEGRGPRIVLAEGHPHPSFPLAGWRIGLSSIPMKSGVFAGLYGARLASSVRHYRSNKAMTMSQPKRIAHADLEQFFLDALAAVGVPPHVAAVEAQIGAEVDLHGGHTHGVALLSSAINYIRQGIFGRPIPALKTIVEYPASRLIDAGGGIGRFSSAQGMDWALEQARQYGVGTCVVRSVGHWGRGHSYALRAARAGLVGLAFTNAFANFPAWGTRVPSLGNNPLAIGIPTADGEPVGPRLGHDPILHKPRATGRGRRTQHPRRLGPRRARKAPLRIRVTCCNRGAFCPWVSTKARDLLLWSICSRLDWPAASSLLSRAPRAGQRIRPAARPSALSPSSPLATGCTTAVPI